MQPFAEWFYKSKSWLDCREDYMRTQFYICERCGAAAKLVHHRIYITPENINDPFITLSFDNLEALCQDCHNKEHHKQKTNCRYRFDDNGNLIPEGNND